MAIQDDNDANFGLLTSCCFIREAVLVASDCDDTLIDRLLHGVDELSFPIIIPFFFFFCALTLRFI